MEEMDRRERFKGPDIGSTVRVLDLKFSKLK